MSKFLKVLVNIFLVTAILIAAAILIPPLAGVSTTIVDSASMDTNLPLGSVTYSTNVDVSRLGVGDEILKDNDISTYAYIIRSGDETTGQYRVVSAADPDGVEEDVVLRNTVPKVAVVVPYIGYIMIAMHSVEGIIIIALVVILMIILFILSELWKPQEDDDDEDQEAVVSAGLSGDNENGIDTAAIRAAMRENSESEVPAEGGQPEEEGGEETLTRAERRALKKARKQAEKEAKAAARAAQAAEDSGVEPFSAGRAEEAAGAAIGAAGGVIHGFDSAPETGEENAPEVIRGAFDRASGTEELLREQSFRAEPDVDVMNGKTRDLNQVFEEVLSRTAEEAPEAASAAEETVSAAPAEEYAGESVPAAQQMYDGPAGADPVYGTGRPDPSADVFSAGESAENAADDIRIIEPEVFLKMEDEPARESSETPFGETAAGTASYSEPEEDVNRFTPVRRPSLSEMIDQAKAAGESPRITDDDQLGMKVLDYSDLL